MTEGSSKESNIPTNLRLLLVLEVMAEAGVPVTPTEVNQDLGLPKPTIHRLFNTLEAEGFIQREMDGRSYSPGHRLRRVSSGVMSSVRSRTARVAILRKLAEDIGETCNIAIPDRDEMIYLDRVETKWPLRIQLPVGTRVPCYCTASGKMYLSSLDTRQLHSYIANAPFKPITETTETDPDALVKELIRIRKTGYSTDRGEFMQDMIAVSVAIQDSNSRLVATLSFHAPEQRLGLDDALEHLPKLQEASQKLSGLLG